MPRSTVPAILISAVIAWLAVTRPVEATAAGCTDCSDGCRECVPACAGTWEEKKSPKPVYSMTCEHACTRGRDPWHAPPPECRCHPPCGEVIVKKRFFKADGPERIERIPKYEVRMVPDRPCPPPQCRRCGDPGPLCWWNPVAWLSRCSSWW